MYKRQGLKYDLDLNLSHYKSVLKSMAHPDYLYEYGALRNYVGGEIGAFWVYQTAGIFQNQAEMCIRDSFSGIRASSCYGGRNRSHKSVSYTHLG